VFPEDECAGREKLLQAARRLSRPERHGRWIGRPVSRWDSLLRNEGSEGRSGK